MTLARQFRLLIQVFISLVASNVLADTSNAPTTIRTPTIQKADCLDFISESSNRIICGFIELPVDHSAPSDQTITLPIVIAGQTQSLSPGASDKAILIPGGGGPGGTMGFGYQYSEGAYLQAYNDLRAAGFDIVIVDQRGAGYAKPNLRCTETVNAFKHAITHTQTFAQEIASYTDAIGRCNERLQHEKHSLTDFDTYQSAEDFLSIINSLAYTSWSTLATSYATVIAQAIEILQPQTFDRIVLDSPVPIDYQQPYTMESSKAAIYRILSLCEKTRRCNKKHPDIKKKFNTVLDRASESPYQVTIKAYNDTETTLKNIELIVSDTTLLDIFITAAYSNHAIANIPNIIDQLHKGRVRHLETFAEDYWYSGTDLDYAVGLSWAIHCKERTPLEEAYLTKYPTHAAQFSTETKLALQQERQICKQLNVGHSNKIKTDKLFTASTLLLAGDLDPVISRQDLSNTADNFSNASTQIIAGMGHAVWYQSHCIRDNVVKFFASVNLDSPPELSTCKDGITRFK